MPDERRLNLLKPLLAKRCDIHFVEDGSHDLVLVAPQAVKGRNPAALADKPFIVNDLWDSEMIKDRPREWLTRDNCVGAWKGSGYHDREIYNTHPEGGSYHTQLIANAYPGMFQYEGFGETVGPVIRDPRLTDAQIDKIDVSASYAHWDRIDKMFRSPEPDWEANRPVDVFFAGTLFYINQYVREHRARCIYTIEMMRRAGMNVVWIEGHTQGFKQYEEQCRKSKVVVSPWGFGARCHRDFEGMLAGCVVVKPDTSWSYTWPDVYADDRMRFCDPSFDDLPQVVASILDAWNTPTLRRRRKNNYDFLHENKPDTVVADRYADLFQRALDRV